MTAAGKPWLLWLTLMAAALLPAQAQEVFYIHTDALGTVVAETDANGNVVRRSEYEPYGRLLNRPVTNGPGYTGHVEDAATGLTYMQQRYYDPGAGRFLSVDPVTAAQGDLRHFNRYAYVYNNPYNFTDPDGRAGLPGFFVGAGIDVAVQVASNMAGGQGFGEAVTNVSVGQVLVSGALGSVGQIGGATAARTAVSSLSNGAKGKLGESTARIGIALRGETVIASQTPAGKIPALGEIAGRGAKAVPDFVTRSKDGAAKVVEAKFGTSGLTGAQRDLASQMDDAFTVSRTTVQDVSNAGGALGAVAGGTIGAAVGESREER